MKVMLWRCTRCQKWSHAQKMPRWHQSFSTSAPLDPSDVIEFDPGTYTHMGGTISEGGYIVRCGPFQAWVAEPAVGRVCDET